MFIDVGMGLPNKCGELISQLNSLMVATFMSKGKSPTSVSRRGLLLDKQTGGIHVTMSITLTDEQDTGVSFGTMNAVVDLYPCAPLNELRLYQHLQHLVTKPRPAQVPGTKKASRNIIILHIISMYLSSTILFYK